jgi:hypothetical protein
MFFNRLFRRFARPMVTVIGVAPLVLAAGTDVGTAGYIPPPDQMQLVTNGPSATRLSQHSIAGGDVVASWQVGAATVTAAALPGSTVTVSSFGPVGQAGGAEASVTLNAVNKTGANAADRAIKAYKSSGRSVYSEAVAVGYSPAEATKLQTNLTSGPLIASASIIGSACATVYGDAGSAYGRACVVQYLMQATQGGDWYIGDKITGSGSDSDWLWKLTGLQSWETYGSGNSIIDWSPGSTQFPSSCGNFTASLGFAGSGISASTTICPDRLDPKFFTRGFGTNWTGCDKNQYVEGTPSVDLDHNLWWASIAVTIHVAIWWNCI